MLGGYAGRVLFVDLDSGATEQWAPPEEFCRKFMGGYGFGVKFLYDGMRPGIDPLSDEAWVGVAAGPLTGTGALIGSRYMVFGKSPLTGTWGDANSGGRFGTRMKRAGFDAVILRGKSRKPVYVLLDEGRIELKDASRLWGQDTHATEDAIRDELGDGSIEVACIGPAGERLCRMAGISTAKGRFAARSGLGAVMGSKMVKAIAVRGEKEIPVALPARLKELVRRYLPQTREGFGEVLRKFGTAGTLAAANAGGDAPVKNWAGVGLVDFPEAELISDEYVIKYQFKKYGCHGCPIACGGLLRVPAGPYSVDWVHKVQYETLGAFGTMCLNSNLESIIKANDICNRYGIDTISTGVCVAFAIECFEEGILTEARTGGLRLRWGDPESIVTLVGQIARGEGFGSWFHAGIEDAARRIGGRAERFAMHIRGEGLPMHDPRWGPGLATTYITDATPARHTQGSEVFLPRGFECPAFPRGDYSGRGRAHKLMADINHVVNCAGLCLFGYFVLDMESIPDFLGAVTGVEYTMEDVYAIGERIANLRHAFNLREGIRFNDFVVPGRMIGDPPLPDGPTAGVRLDVDALVQDYLREMKWDPQTLVPEESLLVRLGLDEVRRDFYG